MTRRLVESAVGSDIDLKVQELRAVGQPARAPAGWPEPGIVEVAAPVDELAGVVAELMVWLPDQLARVRASVRLISGWEARSARRTLDPRWLVCHHTASVPWSGEDANRNVVVNGNAVAPGPIAQLLVQRSGVVEVVAAGSSNNAGAGVLPDGGTDGNAQPGIEAVNAGAGMQWQPGTDRVQYSGSTFMLAAGQLATWQARVDAGEIVRDPSTGMWWEVWSEACLVAYAAAAAAICDHYDWGPDRLVAHAAYAPLRKVDPAGPWFDQPSRPLRADAWMARFRGLVQLVLDDLHRPTVPPPPVEEDPDMPLTFHVTDRERTGRDMLLILSGSGDPQVLSFPGRPDDQVAAIAALTAERGRPPTELVVHSDTFDAWARDSVAENTRPVGGW